MDNQFHPIPYGTEQLESISWFQSIGSLLIVIFILIFLYVLATGIWQSALVAVDEILNAFRRNNK